MVIKIGTRKSRLALVQTQLVKEEIEKKFPDITVEVVPMSTKGDEILDRSLTQFGGKGVFTKELEHALLFGTIDMAVHSAKDMPMEMPEGLCLHAVLKRENPHDVLITTNGISAKDLPAGSVIGTSSLRRELQLKEINSGITFRMIRGNVETRIAKLKQGEYDGILLAAAGLNRLEMKKDGIYFEELGDVHMLPAAGQGILAVQTRTGELSQVLTAISFPQEDYMLRAERAFLKKVGGGCNAPCAAYCQVEEGMIKMQAMNFAGGQVRRLERQCATDDFQSPEQLGTVLAENILSFPVSLVGAGPGDAMLLSRKGLLRVQQAEVIVYDNLAAPSILNEAALDAELIYAGKEASNHHLKQEEINAVLVQKAKEGKRVVRLKGGDPFIFGRGGEEALALRKEGIAYEIIPGVSSSYAAAAYAGIPITHRHMASSFHVITGHEGNHKAEPVLDYRILAAEEGTLCFLMGLSHIADITSALMQNGKAPQTKAAVISRGTTCKQQTVTGTLETITARVQAANVKPPAIILVGDVVSLHDELFQPDGRSLAGKRVLLTGTKKMVQKQAAILEEAGAEAVCCSLIHTAFTDTEQLRQAVTELSEYQWIVFTSANGVELFFDYLQQEQIDIRKLLHMKFAVVGSGTADALRDKNIICDFMPSSFTSEVLAKEWIPKLLPSDKVLLLRAKEGLKLLDEALSAAGISYMDIPLYETVIDIRRKEELKRLMQTVDYTVFASASAVRAYAQLAGAETVPGKMVCIGPVTEAEAKKAQLLQCLTAALYTAEGIRDVMIADVRKSR